MMHRRPRRTVPSWVIVAIGIAGTGGAVLWSTSLRDAQGERLLDAAASAVLVSLLGAATTILGLVLQRTGEVRHQVQNSHPSNLRDDIDAQAAAIEQVREIAQHAVRAARKASQDTVQLREDVQALRVDHSGTASDIRGLRKDVGRVADVITQAIPVISDRLTDLERKKES